MTAAVTFQSLDVRANMQSTTTPPPLKTTAPASTPLLNSPMRMMLRSLCPSRSVLPRMKPAVTLDP